MVSYDLMKAYDRVFIPYLCKVMEAMGFGDRFIAWIKMLHEGATTRFILNWLSRPVKLLMSVRQGDPLAMVLFLIFIEPLLVKIRKSVEGLTIMKLQLNAGYFARHSWVGRQQDEDYVDDINALLGDPNQMVVIDEIFAIISNANLH